MESSKPEKDIKDEKIEKATQDKNEKEKEDKKEDKKEAKNEENKEDKIEEKNDDGPITVDDLKTPEIPEDQKEKNKEEGKKDEKKEEKKEEYNDILKEMDEILKKVDEKDSDKSLFNLCDKFKNKYKEKFVKDKIPIDKEEILIKNLNDIFNKYSNNEEYKKIFLEFLFNLYELWPYFYHPDDSSS